MKSKILLKHFVFICIAFLPLLYMYLNWQSLPDKVAVHFDSEMKPNGFADKSSLWLYIGGVGALAVGVYFLMIYINKVDPKRMNKPVQPVMQKIGMGTLLFLTAINFDILYGALHPLDNFFENFMNPLLGLLFMFLGNLMYNIKPNYFAGIKIPWTLASDYNWKKTHRLGGALWFVGGLVLVITGMILPAKAESYVLNTCLAIMVIVPIVYSFIIFKQEHNAPGYFDKEAS